MLIRGVAAARGARTRASMRTLKMQSIARPAARALVARLQARPLSAAPPPPGTMKAVTGGLPDFVEHWTPAVFKKVGYGLGAAAVAAWPLAMYHELSILAPLLVSGGTAAYWAVGGADLEQKSTALRRNFPVLIHFRYVLESIRPEIQQYFIEPDEGHGSVPFNRAMRSTIYQRAKGSTDTRALGTRRHVYAEGYEWANHTMFPVPADDVEDRVLIGGPACLRPYSASLLNISAMSFGALSSTAIEALNRGAAAGGFYHNTGEGGISRFHLAGGADLCWNVGTGYFGCGKTVDDRGTRAFDPEQFRENATRDAVKMIEIKLSQGAKPAHGGILPAAKITQLIAEARGLGSGPWLTDCASPPRHSAFSDPVGLMRFVRELRELSGGKPIGFKLCVGQPHEFAALVHAMLRTGVAPDFITVDGAEGGTGAAPPEFQDSIGMPLAEGLRLVEGFLTGAGLRDQVSIIAAGKVYNGFSLVRTLALGADITNCARSMMFALGCIQALKCNSNKCPTGIATQNEELSAALHVPTKAERVAHFQRATVHAAREIIGAVGVRRGRDVTQDMIFRRDSGVHVHSLAEVHTEYFANVAAGQLLTDEGLARLTPTMRKWWLQGSITCGVSSAELVRWQTAQSSERRLHASAQDALDGAIAA
eukprot:CAMPEP_0119271720 /NCGR_PEP_ID=MMETSP1329-20130426/8195_1 /TAXON_ID=114041 /ORGANISM="Genus nov. species nov., Strain RCC1024" /LENGTH=649 /DNA_ID=CAMNT_0007271771 /DNA_START=130 /DNA_END=2076 /DNA_ORIENTATION=+